MIRHVQMLAEPSSSERRRRTTAASVSTGMIASAKVQVTNSRPLGKFGAIPE